MLEELLQEFSSEQKMEFIRSVQSIFWTMTPYETLRSMTKEELDDFFKFMYKYTPDELMDKTIEIVREKSK